MDPGPAQPLLDSKAVAQRLGVSVDTLRDWRYEGRGPAFLKLGHRTVRYRPSAIDAWLEEQEVVADAS